jgi:hypothetical protein
MEKSSGMVSRMTENEQEPRGGRRCDRCLCWARMSYDETDMDYDRGYCCYNPPKEDDMVVQSDDGCISRFILKPGIGLHFDNRHLTIVKTKLSKSKGQNQIMEVL